MKVRKKSRRGRQLPGGTYRFTAYVTEEQMEALEERAYRDEDTISAALRSILNETLRKPRRVPTPR